jgi:hypothetical protein
MGAIREVLKTDAENVGNGKAERPGAENLLSKESDGNEEHEPFGQDVAKGAACTAMRCSSRRQLLMASFSGFWRPDACRPRRK